MGYPSTVSLTDMPKHHHQLSIEPIKIQFDSVIQKSLQYGYRFVAHRPPNRANRGKIHGLPLLIMRMFDMNHRFDTLPVGQCQNHSISTVISIVQSADTASR